MTTYLFSVPLRFDTDPHPLGAGPDDMIEVEADNKTEARQKIAAAIGPEFGNWFGLYLPDQSDVAKYYPGERIQLP